MKKIILEEPEAKNFIFLKDFTDVQLSSGMIVAKRDDILQGMINKEGQKGWILKVGSDRGAYGYFSTLKKCLEVGMGKYGYTFYIV